jgi:transcriptional regulator with XRE-family HTH domain
MSETFKAGALLRQARTAAGLSQRELARRAATSQSVVSRIESGRTDPSTGTLVELLAAADVAIRADLEPLPVLDPEMLDDVPRILALTPEQRLLEVGNVARFTQSARRA